MQINKNISLILGILIPILMILLVAGAIYLPGIFIKPKFDFLYLIGDDYYTRQIYSVKNGKLTKNENKQTKDDSVAPREVKFFIHDVSKNESKEITFKEADSLTLDPMPVSTDNFEVISGSRDRGFFPFFFNSSRDYRSQFLKGRYTSKKLNIDLDDSYYYNFRFLGWIK